MGAPSSLATLSTLLHYEVRYTPSESTFKDQGVESNPPIRMAHTFSSLTSSFRWKTPMKKIVSYRPLGTSHQGPIDYIEPRYTSFTAMATLYGRPYMITPEPTPQSPHIIPSDKESISYKPPIPPSIDIDCIPQPSTRVPPNKPINATLHKNSI